MNKFVIDTHIFLWLVFDPDKIDEAKLNILKNPKNRIYIASVTFWEISHKYNLGKLELEGYAPEELPVIAEKMGIETIEIHSKTFASFCKLPKCESHKDPFDRIIIWKCIDEDIALVSQDGKFSEYEAYGLRLI